MLYFYNTVSHYVNISCAYLFTADYIGSSELELYFFINCNSKENTVSMKIMDSQFSNRPNVLVLHGGLEDLKKDFFTITLCLSIHNYLRIIAEQFKISAS